jgi:hypothetical protein
MNKGAPEAAFSRRATAYQSDLERLPPRSPLHLALPRQVKLGPSSPSGLILRQLWYKLSSLQG